MSEHCTNLYSENTIKTFTRYTKLIAVYTNRYTLCIGRAILFQHKTHYTPSLETFLIQQQTVQSKPDLVNRFHNLESDFAPILSRTWCDHLLSKGTVMVTFFFITVRAEVKCS